MVVDPNTVTICLNDASRVIKEVVGVHDADIDLSVLSIGVRMPIGASVMVVGVIIKFRMTSDTRSKLVAGTKVVEDTSELVVTSLGGIEVVESGKFIKWRDGASIVRWNA